MKQLLFLLMLFPGGVVMAGGPDYRNYNVFLQEYVCAKGVDYARIIQDSALAAPIKELASVTESAYSSFTEQEKIAYLINVYNLFTIDLVARNYPLKTGIKDIDKPWGTAFVPLFGKKVSLDYIEHDLLRKKFTEPRIHFALVCASKGCPALSNRAFVDENLEAQLSAAAKKFLTDPAKNRVEGKTLKVSQIFKWYGGDFDKKYGGYQNFILQTLGLKGKYPVKFLEYDWQLNSASCRK